MTLTEFVTELNKITDDQMKLNAMRKHISRVYVPVVEKRVILQTMMEQSVGTLESGARFVDPFIDRINTTVAMARLYTDLKIETDEKHTTFDVYDELVSSRIVSMIASFIGEAELAEFSAVNTDLINTFEIQNNSTEEVISRYVSMFSTVFGAHVESVMKLLQDKETVDKIKENFVN